MKHFSYLQKNIVVTGGASGIGKLMVKMLLEKGAATVVIWDINANAMEALKSELGQDGTRIFSVQVDLNNPEDIAAAVLKTTASIKNIHGIINNAGIVTGKLFHEHSLTEIMRTMQINTNALMQVAHSFLPGMMEQNHGFICNISSMASLSANPKMSVYCASKWAVTGWSDSLKVELLQMNKDISVTTVLPYYINTGMFDGVQSKLLPILNPEKTATKIIRAIETRKERLTMPPLYWFIRASQGLLPIKIFDLVADKIFGIYSSMNNFKGRNQ